MKLYTGVGRMCMGLHVHGLGLHLGCVRDVCSCNVSLRLPGRGRSRSGFNADACAHVRECAKNSAVAWAGRGRVLANVALKSECARRAHRGAAREWGWQLFVL